MARCALAVSERFKGRKGPFTQAALDKWIDEQLADLDVDEFMRSEL